MSNPYLDLTAELNRGRLRALLSSGQAVVVHRLAVMSKDGDWILRENGETVEHVLEVLSRHQAHYRFGAPLDLRWLAGGWSSHFEFRRGPLRLRTDFVTRPPRISPDWLAELWAAAEAQGTEVIPLEPLAAIKLTNRDKDYPVVGELARQMIDPRARLRYSRSSRDLIAMSEEYPELVAEAARERPVLGFVSASREALEEALDRERRTLMRANEERLSGYRDASAAWAAAWPGVSRQIEGLSLLEAHRVVAERAAEILPFVPAPRGEKSE